MELGEQSCGVRRYPHLGARGEADKGCAGTRLTGLYRCLEADYWAAAHTAASSVAEHYGMQGASHPCCKGLCKIPSLEGRSCFEGRIGLLQKQECAKLILLEWVPVLQAEELRSGESS